MEYTAVFLAVLFPGAVVAFNEELLKALPRYSALRVYCAGIWHNAACCAVCGLLLLNLPLVLSPFYMQGESPMVLDVSSTSPLSGALFPGDLIISMDDIHIRNKKEWMKMATLLDEQSLPHPNKSNDVKHFVTDGRRRGFCVPSYLMEESRDFQLADGTCPKELTAFSTLTCSDSSKLVDGGSDDYIRKRGESMHYCLIAEDIVKLKKCDDGWLRSVNNTSNCLCSEEESCLTLVQTPGLTWVEITYKRPNSPECRQLGKSSSPGYDQRETSCGGAFIFIGDVISMAQSVRLTAYQSRWTLLYGVYFPSLLEKLLLWTYHISLTLALLNSLPVYFLDGEFILEVSLSYLTRLNQRKKELVLRWFLLGGTLIATIVFFRLFLPIT